MTYTGKIFPFEVSIVKIPYFIQNLKKNINLFVEFPELWKPEPYKMSAALRKTGPCTQKPPAGPGVKTAYGEK